MSCSALLWLTYINKVRLKHVIVGILGRMLLLFKEQIVLVASTINVVKLFVEHGSVFERLVVINKFFQSVCTLITHFFRVRGGLYFIEIV